MLGNWGKTEIPQATATTVRSKNFANDVELIQMLSRCGHGIAFSQIEEKTLSALYPHKMALAPANEVPWPENFQVTLAWDNTDRLEETLSSVGTSSLSKWYCRPSQAFCSEPPSAPWN